MHHAPVALQAFEAAAQAGLGPGREPFRIVRVCGISPTGRPVPEPRTWMLGDAAAALAARLPEGAAVRLECRIPLRILRRGRLIARPTTSDLAVAALRRLTCMADVAVSADLAPRVLEGVRRLPASRWRGRRRDFARWSARQNRSIVLRGVCGSLEIAHGARALSPLLAAGQWLHIGKGTVFGLGRLDVGKAHD
ncbi:CRISPR system precrRNA processing endoribonuclease RAMP protein Cas6 [Nitratireductor sp. XY-223]|uniref:CRISPR system precrRNA processing endoribonuclease RAMP protein Cas6 n=1 Tax=Nitratireductor sp. XY-223 TaxID=2561926 RepID=UPI00145B10A7|nr:CRISPR system precrRNA processing endoribonuclease RAMP protein Cas6 [Nitratireductor sp. XY-223]